MTSTKRESEFTARNKVLRAAFPNCFSLRLRDYNPTAQAGRCNAKFYTDFSESRTILPARRD